MFQRITKQEAKRLFECGETIVLCPCKLRPGFPWSPHSYSSQRDDRTFAQLLASWTFYNSSWEAGYYPHFYLEIHADTGMPVGG